MKFKERKLTGIKAMKGIFESFIFNLLYPLNRC